MRQREKEPQGTQADQQDPAAPAAAELADLPVEPLPPEQQAAIRGGGRTGDIDSGIKIAVDR
jgi:hypothetical protein